ncbi:Anthranilate phosphoribosyltransferase like [hydrothermal vent metagenome]|uniref:Anthranilate phosphoribosyltransferase like n=1 Tax=hydrothermal vent metagenome TaxID=652676 RepID=A0A1W1CW88_9ZZZZ
MDFFKYIHAVGTGPKGNRDLSFDEARDMMRQILDQSVPSEQIAAFLLGWRLKPETIEEFQGALAACDENIITKKVENSIELGYPFDGKAKNPYIFPLVAKALQKHNLNLIITSDKKQPAKNGITIQEIADEIDLASNIHYFKRKDFFNKLHKLTEIRNKLGLRSGFSTIEKLSGVAKSDYAITGVFHKPFVKKYAAIYANRYKRLAMIQGNEGTPELFSKGRLWIVEGENIQEYIVNPEEFGIYYKKSWEKITLQDSIAQLQNPSYEFLKLARLNAAVYLFIAQKHDSIEEAFEALT